MDEVDYKKIIAEIEEISFLFRFCDQAQFSKMAEKPLNICY